jgi:glycine hydroxymethyltransferase
MQLLSRPLSVVAPKVAAIIKAEEVRQQAVLNFIASEGLPSRAVQTAIGSVLVRKYGEGYSGKRYYPGCVNVDELETLTIQLACQVFGAEHANLYPLSGTEANRIAYHSLLKPGDSILAMRLNAGGHISHGDPISFSSKEFQFAHYTLRADDELLDYEEVAKMAEQHRPQLILAGGSSYSRVLNFARFRQIADSVGAKLMVDMAHFSGLVAAGVYPSPVPYADIVTSTGQKSLRAPRLGFILCPEKYAMAVDQTAFPGNNGGPHFHSIAGLAVALTEALEPDYPIYGQQIVANARALAAVLDKRGHRIISAGKGTCEFLTDTHVFLVDVFRNSGLRGKKYQDALEAANINANRNPIPSDPDKPYKPSGVRFGTPAVTARGLEEDDIREAGELIADIIDDPQDTERIASVRERVHQFTERFPLYEG